MQNRDRIEQVASTCLLVLFSPDSKGFVKNIRFGFVCERELALRCALSNKAIDRGLKVCLLASRAAAWSGKAFSFFEHIPAGHAAKREHHKLPFLRHYRPSDMRKMLVDFPFPNADGLGDLPGGHFFIIQEE